MQKIKAQVFYIKQQQCPPQYVLDKRRYTKFCTVVAAIESPL